MSPTLNQMPTPLTPAQMARQGERDSNGQYADSTQSEADGGTANATMGAPETEPPSRTCAKDVAELNEAFTLSLDDTLTRTPEEALASRRVAANLHEEFPGLRAVSFEIHEGFDVDSDFFQPRVHSLAYQDGKEPLLADREEVEASLTMDYSEKMLEQLHTGHDGLFTIGVRK